MTLPALAEADKAAKEFGERYLESIDALAQELGVTEKAGWKAVRILASTALTKGGAYGLSLYGYIVGWAVGAYTYGLKDSGTLSIEKLDMALKRVETALGENPIEKITSQLSGLHNCLLCEKSYEYWLIPTPHWQKIPEELWDKYLCFGCYLKKLREEER